MVIFNSYVKLPEGNPFNTFENTSGTDWQGFLTTNQCGTMPWKIIQPCPMINMINHLRAIFLNHPKNLGISKFLNHLKSIGASILFTNKNSTESSHSEFPVDPVDSPWHGTSSWYLKALELSMTTVLPLPVIWGENLRRVERSPCGLTPSLAESQNRRTTFPKRVANSYNVGPPVISWKI